MTSFFTKNASDSVLDHLAASGGELSRADLIGMLDMCQIASCHERGERYVRQVGHYVERGGVLRVEEAGTGNADVVDSLEKLRTLILQYDGALDIANGPDLRPARE